MNDFDYIKNRFDNDELKAPEDLSPEQMMAMLDERASEPQKGEGRKRGNRAFLRSRKFRAGLSLAACLLLVVISVPRLMGPPDTSMTEEGYRTYESYDELKRLVRSIRPEQSISFFHGNGSMLVEEDMAVYEEAAGTMSDAAPAASADGGAAKTESASETYHQVEGVDEADKIKTDGKYIYLVTGEGDIRILRADKGETKKVAEISQFESDGTFYQIYLSGSRLIAVGSVYDDEESKTAVTTYDISDPENPEQIYQFLQSGYLVSSRLTDGIVYLVTNDNVAYLDRYVPYVTNDGRYEKVAVSDICVFPEPQRASYAVVSAINVSSGRKMSSKTKAILGCSNDIYCNTEHLYLADSGWQTDAGGGQYVTRLLRVDLNGGQLKFSVNGKVRGYIDNQFSMDEKDGYFRVATTSSRNGRDVNNLYVLDDELKQVGSVTGFARDEHIESVRFIGDKAYVITYERTDPLFILDLADPADPKIEGSVKISGFSSLLVPVDEKHLLGIGYATRENEWGGITTDGLKLALFDISDPAEPKVLVP